MAKLNYDKSVITSNLDHYRRRFPSRRDRLQLALDLANKREVSVKFVSWLTLATLWGDTGEQQVAVGRQLFGLHPALYLHAGQKAIVFSEGSPEGAVKSGSFVEDDIAFIIGRISSSKITHGFRPIKGADKTTLGAQVSIDLSDRHEVTANMISTNIVGIQGTPTTVLSTRSWLVGSADSYSLEEYQKRRSVRIPDMIIGDSACNNFLEQLAIRAYRDTGKMLLDLAS